MSIISKTFTQPFGFLDGIADEQAGIQDEDGDGKPDDEENSFDWRDRPDTPQITPAPQNRSSYNFISPKGIGHLITTQQYDPTDPIDPNTGFPVISGDKPIVKLEWTDAQGNLV